MTVANKRDVYNKKRHEEWTGVFLDLALDWFYYQRLIKWCKENTTDSWAVCCKGVTIFRFHSVIDAALFKLLVV